MHSDRFVAQFVQPTKTCEVSDRRRAIHPARVTGGATSWSAACPAAPARAARWAPRAASRRGSSRGSSPPRRAYAAPGRTSAPRATFSIGPTEAGAMLEGCGIGNFDCGLRNDFSNYLKVPYFLEPSFHCIRFKKKFTSSNPLCWNLLK